MQVLAVVFSSLPFIAAILFSLLFLAYAGITLSKQRFVLYPYLILLLTISGTTFGMKEAVAPSIYGRGSGVLYAPFLMWLLLGAFIWMRFTLVFARDRMAACNLHPWFAAWLVLLAGLVGIGLALGQPLKEIVGGMSFSTSSGCGFSFSLCSLLSAARRPSRN